MSLQLICHEKAYMFTVIREFFSRYLYKSFTHIIQLARSDKREYIINAEKPKKFCPTEVIEERQ